MVGVRLGRVYRTFWVIRAPGWAVSEALRRVGEPRGLVVEVSDKGLCTEVAVSAQYSPAVVAEINRFMRRLIDELDRMLGEPVGC